MGSQQGQGASTSLGFCLTKEIKTPLQRVQALVCSLRLCVMGYHPGTWGAVRVVSGGDPSCLWASVCTSGPRTAARETAEDNDVWTWRAGEEASLGQEMQEGSRWLRLAGG